MGTSLAVIDKELTARKTVMRTHGWSVAAKLAYHSVRAENGCLLYLGSRTKGGYGKMEVDGVTELVHRLTWIENKGPVPQGKCVLHTCDVRHCREQDHLFLGDHDDNAKDRDRKGRGGGWRNRGDRHGMVRLSAAQVRAIRKSPLLQRELAAKYGVRRQHISEIKSRRVWAHLE